MTLRRRLISCIDCVVLSLWLTDFPQLCCLFCSGVTCMLLHWTASLNVCVFVWGQAYLINVVWKCYKYLVATLAGVMPTVARCQSDVEHGQLLSPSTSQPSSIQTVTATLDPASATARDAQVSISILCCRTPWLGLFCLHVISWW